MNTNALRASLAAALLLSGFFLFHRSLETKAATPAISRDPLTHAGRTNEKVAATWDAKAAASYLDSRENWWADRPRAARDHGTFCVSCHTAVPYAISRPMLRKALAEQGPSANERALLDSVTKRVRLWNEVAPFYSDADRGEYKTVESRGTESVLNALILASNDSVNGQLSNDTLKAFGNMWAEQQTAGDRNGAWMWLRFRNEPWEADDSGYFGATLAAVASELLPRITKPSPKSKAISKSCANT